MRREMETGYEKGGREENGEGIRVTVKLKRKGPRGRKAVVMDVWSWLIVYMAMFCHLLPSGGFLTLLLILTKYSMS